MNRQLLLGTPRRRVFATDAAPYLAATLRRAAQAPRLQALALEGRHLWEFPVLTRDDLARDPDSLLVGDVPEQLRRWVTTGGSTGRPVGFWLDRAISLSEWRFMTTQWRSIGYNSRSWRVVLRGRYLDGGRTTSWSLARRELRLSSFHLSTRTLPRYLSAISRLPTPFLHAYPSSALRFAQLCEEHGVRPPRFRGVLLGSEQVFDGQRAELTRLYEAPVFSWYGQSEKVLLGGECSYSRHYHLYPSYGVAEIVDEQGAPVMEPGKIGRLLGTGLLNLSAPLVRYDTGDLASWAPTPCACGFRGQLLERVAGRSQDFLTTPDGARVTVAALNLHSTEYDGIQQLQYRQMAADQVHLVVVPGSRWTDEGGDELLARVTERLPGIHVALRVVDSIEPEQNGKTPLVKAMTR